MFYFVLIQSFAITIYALLANANLMQISNYPIFQKIQKFLREDPKANNIKAPFS